MASAQGLGSRSDRRQQAVNRVMDVSNSSMSTPSSPTHTGGGSAINSSTRIRAHPPTSSTARNTSETGTGRSGIVSARGNRVAGSPPRTTSTHTVSSNADTVQSGAGNVSGGRNRVAGSTPRTTSMRTVSSNAVTV